MGEYLPKHLLTKDVLDEIITRRYQEDKTLAVDRITDEMFSRWQIKDAAIEFYGSWTDARIKNGTGRGRQRKSSRLYTKKETVKELRKLLDEGHSMKIKDFENKLTYSIQKHFGGYINAKNEIGIKTSMNITPLREQKDKSMRKYSIEGLAEKLKSAAIESKNMNVLHNEHGNIINAIYKRGYTLHNFVDKFNIQLPKYEYISTGVNKYTDAGRRFEIVLGEILIDMGVTYSKYAHERLQPDFVLPNNHWADAKLSHWTDYREMLKKYTPHCDELTVVYMRGPITDEAVEGDFPHRKVSVYKLLDELDETRRKYYVNKLNEIETELSAA